MTPFMSGFADELIKLGDSSIKVNVDLEKAFKKAQRKGSKRYADKDLAKLQRRDLSHKYLTSMAFGSLVAPVTMVIGKRTRGVLHKLFKSTRAKPVHPITMPELGEGMARGALGGAIVQTLFSRR